MSQATEKSRFSLSLGETNCPEDEVALLSSMFYAFLSTTVVFLVLRKFSLFQEMFLKNIIRILSSSIVVSLFFHFHYVNVQQRDSDNY